MPYPQYGIMYWYVLGFGIFIHWNLLEFENKSLTTPINYHFLTFCMKQFIQVSKKYVLNRREKNYRYPRSIPFLRIVKDLYLNYNAIFGQSQILINFGSNVKDAAYGNFIYNF